MNLKNTTLVKGGLFASIICLLTFFVRIPLPIVSGAYVNAGDAGVYLAAAVLGGWPAVLASAVGSALADLLGGAVVYIAPTFVIKGAMVLIASAILAKNPQNITRQAIAFLAAGLAMAAGYFLYELPLFGIEVALYSIPFNAIQIAGGVFLGVFVTQAVQKTKLNTLV